MATLATPVLTLADWAKRIDPDGKTPLIVEMLNQRNEVLADMMLMEGNLPTGHRTTVRTGLPTVTWRLLNNGVTPSKSSTAQIDEATGILEAWSEVDKDLAELNGNQGAFRLSEARAFIEAMNQEMATKLFYGNQAVNPEQITGFAPRYAAKSGATNGQNVVLGGGSGSVNTSIWLVCWGDQSCFGIFPKGTKAGLVHEDLGLQTITVTTGIGGTKMLGYQDRWQWKIGLALRDWRYVVRIANIDTTNLVAESSAADLPNLMIRALHRIPNIAMGRPAFYMNRTAFEFLDIQRRENVIVGGQLKYEDVDGKNTPTFRGIPVRIVDALLNTEATIS